MAYQYKREPLTQEEANRLAQACETVTEKLVLWTLLDTGMRVAEFTSLTPKAIDWQLHRITVNGKGGPFGSRSKLRVIAMTDRVQQLLEHHFVLQEKIGFTPRGIQKLVKRVANRARISRPVTPHILRHTFSVTCLRKGVSLPALKKLLGHERLETTGIYLNLSPDDVLEEFRKKW